MRVGGRQIYERVVNCTPAALDDLVDLISAGTLIVDEWGAIGEDESMSENGFLSYYPSGWLALNSKARPWRLAIDSVEIVHEDA